MPHLIEILGQTGRFLHSWCPPMLLQSTILFAILALADRLTRRRLPARALYALWLLTLLKLILPPSLALPGSPASWISNMSWPPTRRADANTSKGAWFIEATEAANAKDPATPAPSGKKPIHAQQPIGLALVWITGVTALTIALVRNARRVCQDVRLSTPASPALEQLAADCARELGLRHPVRLRIGAPGKVPLLTGFRQPVILLPACLTENGAVEQIRPILLHEMAHLRRGDLWVHWAQSLVQIAYWWHPLVWLANARIRQLREEATDETVVQAMSGDTFGYAEALLRVADLCKATRPSSFASSQLFASRSGLRRRVERLGDPAWSGWRAPAGRGWLIAAILAVLLLPMSPTLTAKAQAPAIAKATPTAEIALTKSYDLGTNLPAFIGLLKAEHLLGSDRSTLADQFWRGPDFRDRPEMLAFDFQNSHIVLKATRRDHARFQGMLEEHFALPAQIQIESKVLVLSRETWEKLSLDAKIRGNRSRRESGAASLEEARKLIRQLQSHGATEPVVLLEAITESGRNTHLTSPITADSRFDLGLKPEADQEERHITTALTASLSSPLGDLGNLYQPGKRLLGVVKGPAWVGPEVCGSITSADGGVRIAELPLNEELRKSQPDKKYLLLVRLLIVDPTGHPVNHLPDRMWPATATPPMMD